MVGIDRDESVKHEFAELESVQKLLSHLKIPYFYIGGWGIDLFLGRVTRDHGDVEVTIYRYQQEKLFSWARSAEIVDAGYTLHVVDPPGTANIPIWDGQHLEDPIHQLQLYCKGERIVDFMLSDLDISNPDSPTWQFRRDPVIQTPKSQIEWLYVANSAYEAYCPQYMLSLPYHAPEILLLYKAKRNAEKDRVDRNRAWSKMDLTQKEWLVRALRQYNFKHQWLDDLLPL